MLLSYGGPKDIYHPSGMDSWFGSYKAIMPTGGGLPHGGTRLADSDTLEKKLKKSHPSLYNVIRNQFKLGDDDEELPKPAEASPASGMFSITPPPSPSGSPLPPVPETPDNKQPQQDLKYESLDPQTGEVKSPPPDRSKQSPKSIKRRMWEDAMSDYRNRKQKYEIRKAQVASRKEDYMRVSPSNVPSEGQISVELFGREVAREMFSPVAPESPDSRDRRLLEEEKNREARELERRRDEILSRPGGIVVRKPQKPGSPDAILDRRDQILTHFGLATPERTAAVKKETRQKYKMLREQFRTPRK